MDKDIFDGNKERNMEIYNAEKHINLQIIENIVKGNSGKKIICFGGGTAAEIFMEKFSDKYAIDCFLDNNTALHGKKMFGREICSPDYLKELQTGEYIVLILSKHVDAISKQLEGYGLKENQNYYDIYNHFIEYFRIKKFEKNAYHFVNFIERIPDGYLDNIPLKRQETIGIVCFGDMVTNLTWYSMAQSILLRYNGYKSTLIIDTLKSFGSYIYFEGMEEVARVYIDYVVSVLKKKCSDIEVHYVTEEDVASLDEEDIQMTEKYASLVVKWLDSRRDEVFLPEDNNRIKVAAGILKSTLGSIKAYLEKNPYDTINVYTGLHKHRCVYNYVGHKLGMRVSTYDGDEYDGGITFYDTDGVSGYAEDVKQILEKDLFTAEEKEKIIALAKEHFESRRSSTIKDAGYNYQITGYSEQMVPYDIVLPMNIFWDSAALGRDDVFSDELNWLTETLEYIMKNTDATVLVREHPAQNTSDEFFYVDYSAMLPILEEYKDRIHYAKSGEKLNTYQYVEKSKLILPYTSTMGVESALLGKNVILHTNVYYDSCGIAYKAKSKEDYFEKIKYYLVHTEEKTCKNMENAYLAYYSQMKHFLPTRFSECYTEWMDYDLEQVNQMEGVQKIIAVIARNENSIVKSIREII